MPGLQTVSPGTAARLADLPEKARARVIRRLTANAWEELPPPASVLELQVEASVAPTDVETKAMHQAKADANPSLVDTVAEVVQQAEAMALPTPVGENLPLGNAPVFTNALNVNTINNINDGYFNQPLFTGFDPGVDEGTALSYAGAFQPTETLFGAPLVAHDVQMDANNQLNITKTFQMLAGAPITPALLAHVKATVEASMAGVTATVTAQQETWGVWNQNYYQQVITNQVNAWGVWNSGTITIQTTAAATGAYIYNPAIIQSSWSTWTTARFRETEGQRKAREEREVRAAAEYAEQQKKAADEALKAQARAEKLLVKYITPEMALTLSNKGYFDVDVGEKTYRIWRGTHGNIRELNKEKTQEVASLCVQPENVPVADAMLAQYLWLRSDEKALLRVANRRELVIARP